MKPTLLFLAIICIFSFSSFSLFSQNSDIPKLKNNLLRDALVNRGYTSRVERYITPDYSKAKEYLRTLSKDGAWKDVDYTDRDNKWDPLHHLDRMLVMSYNFMKEDSRLYQNKRLLSGIEKSIEYWYTINPKCNNWYKNSIAKQFYFNVIALLLEGKIDKSLHLKMVNDLTERPRMEGYNRTVLATSTFYKGILTDNPEMIKLGVSGVTDQIEITTDHGGIQPDFSFHQHGHFLYNGGYGFQYLRESAWLATIVHGTEFAYSNEHIKILRNYYLEGTRWMIRGEVIDHNVRGRQVGHDPKERSKFSLIPILKQMIIADPDYKDAYLTSIELIMKQLPQNTFGHKHFWRSDYTIHHREKYSTSLKMCSERTVGIELNMNSENKLGYWLPYGLTYIYRLGNEYDAIFPSWDWARLPGVTNPYVEIDEKRGGAKYTQNTSFVGGLSNGKYGVSAMDFSMNKTKAHKAWFWFDDEWVALGAGIESEHDSIIITSVNQCLLTGTIQVNGEKFSGKRTTLKDPKWIKHDEIAYIFPKETQVELKADFQKGNLQRIYGLGKDTVYSTEVYSLWFNHGKNPKDACYQYIVVPGVSDEYLSEYNKNIPVNILSNTKQVQAVHHKGLNLLSLVFYEKGEFEHEDTLIKTDAPCLVLMDWNRNELSVSDPTQELSEIDILVQTKDKILIDKKIRLPSHGFAGKSLTLKMN